MPRTRAKYEPTAVARKILDNMSVEDLQSKQIIWDRLRQKGVKMSPQAMGRLRAASLRQKSGGNTEKSRESLKGLETVVKTINAVGGIEELERYLFIIKKVKVVL